MVRSKKRTDDPPDPDRPELDKPMYEIISRDPRYVAIAKLVLHLSFACLIQRLNEEGLSDRGTRLTLHKRLIRYDIQTVNPREVVPWDPVVDERAPGDAPLTPDALRLLQQREEDEWGGIEEDEYSDGGEADALRPSVAAPTTAVTQSSTTTTNASTQSTTTTLTAGVVD
ncbi:hypothetical protein QAD02_007848 [Eretmocerus hayati]|uniref:Uncharacterized protein n=1 Tax=Eretmocerus hayati TaxID=131215 RepID=A0ACC2N541_9HYME|nr:hypothetical protein QAD02_007848 [Eretmocerus hayati]